QESGDTYGYLRTYDPGAMYAPVTGYYSVVYGFTGIERTLNDALSGEADALFYHRISDILSGRQGRGATVELTLDSAAQEAAWKALEGRRGAAVALDPETGAVLAMVSAPSFDPNRLASHDGPAVAESWTALNDDPDRPLTNRAIGGGLYPPRLRVQARRRLRGARIRAVPRRLGDPRARLLAAAERLRGDVQPRLGRHRALRAG